MKKIKEEDIQYDTFYNDVEFSLKVTHIPTGLYEESGKLISRRFYFPIKKVLVSELRLRLIEEGYEI